MSILKLLGFKREDPVETETGDTETVRKVVRELDALEPDHARYIAAFAYILSRVANADLDISEEETLEMERIVKRFGSLPDEQAVLVVQIAKTQSRLLGSTEDYLVTREFKAISTPEQRRELLDCLFAVSASDDTISSAEETQIRQISSELGFTHKEFVTARAVYSDKREVLRPLREKR